jgi:NAD/NADP transhydrogenase alpha subunit
MRIGIPRELKPREGRVGLIPAACVELVRGGHEVFVEHSAGEKSGYSDQDFRDVGVTVIPTADELFDKSQMIVKVKNPSSRISYACAKITCCSVTCTSRRCPSSRVDCAASVSRRWHSKPSRIAPAACRCSRR